MRVSLLVGFLLSLTVLASACGSADEPSAAPVAATTGAPTEAPGLPVGGEPVSLDPADFAPTIDNPFWPMAPGTTWVYRETDGEGNEQRVEVTVTDRTRTILGIRATVVHDVVTEDGQVREDTYDWYAQDRWGNVWYLGEDTREYEEGKVSTEGSWEAGVDGAQAGVIMPADPTVGVAYRQEYYAGEAEDAAEVLSLDEQVEAPYGSFDNVLQTRDTTPLQPDLIEEKYYAPGVGPVLAVSVSGEESREELLTFEKGG